MARIYDVGGSCWEELSEWANLEDAAWADLAPLGEASLVLVARGDEDQLIGCLVVEGLDLVPRLGPLLVGRAFRSQGIGCTLLDAAEGILAERGCTGIEVELPWGDDALLGMAQRRGYVPEVVRLVKDISAVARPVIRGSS